MATSLHPELPFVEARVRFASGDVDRAAAQLRTALDTASSKDFRLYQGTATVVSDIAAAANVFAYQGDLTNAAKTLELADQVRREVVSHPEWSGSKGEGVAPGQLGELYAAAGGPSSALRQIWQSTAEAARMSPSGSAEAYRALGGKRRDRAVHRTGGRHYRPA